jgi:hypothetical protein
MTVKAQVRQVNRNGLVLAFVLALLGNFFLFSGLTDRIVRIAAIGFMSAGAILGLLVVAGMIWPRWHFVLRRLSAYGPPGQVAAAIDAELAHTDSLLSFGQPVRSFRISSTGKYPVLITPSWLLQFGELGLRVARLNDVTWYYKKILTIHHSLGKEHWYAVVVHERNGREEEFVQTEAEVDRLMKELVVLLPGVRCGYPF